MRPYLVLFALFSLSPFLVSATSNAIPAGFAPTSVFASKTNITEGDTISLFTVLYNQSTDDLSGDVVFTVDGNDVGTKHFSLQAGETQTPSMTWSAVRGSHQASAHIENITGSDGGLSLLNDKADAVTLTVAAPPAPSAAAAAVQNVTQAVVPAARSAFNSLEYLRGNVVHMLSQQLAAGAPPKAAVLSAETYRPDMATGTESTGKGVFSSIWWGILQALLFICSVRVLFYISLLLVLFIVYKLIRAIFAERH